MISIVQNFICTKESRLKLLEIEVPKMSEIFKDYEFFINYNTTEFLEEVYDIYNNSIEKLNFYNNLEMNWGSIVLSMVNEITTPYIMTICEDYEYYIDYKDFKEIIDEMVKSDVSYMPIGRLWKYTEEKYCNIYDEGEKLWYYTADKSPGSSFSVNGIYKRELFYEKLVDLISYNSRRFPLNVPHHFEDIFHEPNGVRLLGKEVLCAIPKEIIIQHMDPGFGNIAEKEFIYNN